MAPLYPILNKRIPRRYLYIGGMISMIVAYVLLVLFYIPGTLIQMTMMLATAKKVRGVESQSKRFISTPGIMSSR